MRSCSRLSSPKNDHCCPSVIPHTPPRPPPRLWLPVTRCLLTLRHPGLLWLPSLPTYLPTREHLLHRALLVHEREVVQRVRTRLARVRQRSRWPACSPAHRRVSRTTKLHFPGRNRCMMNASMAGTSPYRGDDARATYEPRAHTQQNILIIRPSFACGARWEPSYHLLLGGWLAGPPEW